MQRHRVGRALASALAMIPCGLLAHAAPQCTSSCSTPQSCTFDGFTNTALGGAQLHIDAACQLVVSGIGTSGADGVSQGPLPASARHAITQFGGANFGAGSQPGERQLVTCHATVPGGVLGRIRVENVGNQTIAIDTDFSSIGATRYAITVMDHGAVAGVFTDLPSGLFTTNQCTEVEVD